MKDITELENCKIPKRHVTLVGVGRLGIKIGVNLIQVHRGGPNKITAIDNQKISSSDIIFKLLGGNFGDYKVDLLSSLCTHPENIRKIISVREDLTLKNLDLIYGDVVSIQIAGGNTIPITAAAIKRAHDMGAKTISTAGVFGIGAEEILTMDISQADDKNPVVRELREHGIEKNHKIVTTGKFIEDNIPITPYVLDKIANIMTREILKMLIKI
ncbi:MAG: hypothetical protein LLF83_03145 [Methanobacterium sp.]|nr:hypothetical protein [Methanobacterium sp.]